jgi:hypothetical protein
MEALVTRVEVTRHVAADPASVALLLAEPPAAQDADQGWVIAPPRRAGVGFVSGAAASTLSGFTAVGDVSVEPATDAGCEVRLVIAVDDDASSGRAERSATKFLSQLANRARSRAFAA